jgi:PIN domain nuclease of toxin-antitoxin system
VTDFLLDTHSFLWFVWNDAKLSAPARSLIIDGKNRIALSLAGCWEISIKAGLRKLQLGEPSGSFLTRETARNRVELLSIELMHVAEVESLPHHHRDPFDRLLIAQARCEGLTIISADETLDRYGVTRVW